ncbi:ubiquitin-conjugating enzyme E2 M [Enteropsectra breve]|nr:ubiquitin-conjugating enzyme E2 M [Enteropsectra breve]
MTFFETRIVSDIENISVPLKKSALKPIKQGDDITNIIENNINNSTSDIKNEYSKLCFDDIKNDIVVNTAVGANLENILRRHPDIRYIFNFTVAIETEVYKKDYAFGILFSEEYPFKSPIVICYSRVMHPNIDENGSVCLQVLREGWMAAYDINSIIVSIIDVFYYPSGEDALNVEVGKLVEQDYEEFKRRASSL